MADVDPQPADAPPIEQQLSVHAGAAEVPDDVPHDERFDARRPKWSSRWVFWLAAVGSAVGLGNLWRFPWQCANWGGGAFLVAYFISLFFIGMPLLTQELALGHRFRSGDIEAFGKMNWRLRGIGLASVIGAYGIVTYYSVIIACSVVFFFESMRQPLPYGKEKPDWWTDNVLITRGYPPEKHSEGVISGRLFIATIMVWVCVFWCIFKGVRSASLAVKVTMPLPLLLIFILLIRGCTLSGAGNGIEHYLNFKHWGELSKPDIWDAAVGQCFFSLSVCMGVMTAYASYNPPTQNIAADEKVISFLDVGVSFVSGFVVYSVLGHLTKVTRDCFSDCGDTTDATYATCIAECGDDDWYTNASFGLVFSAYPSAIAEFPQDGTAQFFGVIFFATLFLLGIDSAFSMVEGISTVVYDSDLGRQLGWSREKISMTLCVSGLIWSTLYCFDFGLYFLDIVDRYINNYGMVFIGMCECVASGWFYKFEEQVKRIGKQAMYIYDFGMAGCLVLSVVLSVICATPENKGRDSSGHKVYAFNGGLGGDSYIMGLVIGLVGWVVILIAAYIVSLKHTPDEEEQQHDVATIWKRLWWIAGWIGNEDLRAMVNENGLGMSPEEWEATRFTLAGELKAAVHHSTIGIWWGFVIKYFQPAVLFVLLLSTMREESYNNYGGYEWKHLLVGIFIFSGMVICVFTIGFFPQVLRQSGDENLFASAAELPKTQEDGPTTQMVVKETDIEEEDAPAKAVDTAKEATPSGEGDQLLGKETAEAN